MRTKRLVIPVLILISTNSLYAADKTRNNQSGCMGELTRAAIERLDRIPTPLEVVGIHVGKLIPTDFAKRLESIGAQADLIPKWDVLSPLERSELISLMRTLAPDSERVESFRSEVNAAGIAIAAADSKIDRALASPEVHSSLWGWLFNTERYRRYAQLTDARSRAFRYVQLIEPLKTISEVMVETTAIVGKSPLFEPNRVLTGSELFSPEVEAGNSALLKYLYVLQQLEKVQNIADATTSLAKLAEQVGDPKTLQGYLDKGKVGVKSEASYRNLKNPQDIVNRLAELFDASGFDEAELKKYVDQLRRRESLTKSETRELDGFLDRVSQTMRRGSIQLLLDSARALVESNQSEMEQIRRRSRVKDKPRYIELAEDQRRSLQLVVVLETLEKTASSIQQVQGPQTVSAFDRGAKTPASGYVSSPVRYVSDSNRNSSSDDWFFWWFYYSNVFHSCHHHTHCDVLVPTSYHTLHSEQTLDEIRSNGLTPTLHAVPEGAATSLRDEFPDSGIRFGGLTADDYVGLETWKTDETIAGSVLVQSAWDNSGSDATWRDEPSSSDGYHPSHGSSTWNRSDNDGSSDWSSTGASDSSVRSTDWSSPSSGGSSDWSSTGGSSDWSSSGGSSDWGSSGGSDFSSGGDSGGGDW